MIERSTPETEKAATQKDALSLTNTRLLGIFGPEDELKALVRYPDGQIATLAPGASSRLGPVLGIKPQAVYVETKGQARVLRMPKIDTHDAEI